MGYELAITSGVPIPPAGQRGRRKKYHFDSMNVGDSFFVSAKRGKKVRDLQHRLSSSCRQFCSDHEPTWRFVTRQTEHDGMPGVGVWRTE